MRGEVISCVHNFVHHNMRLVIYTVHSTFESIINIEIIEKVIS
jgi:hypothetical protein